MCSRKLSFLFSFFFLFHLWLWMNVKAPQLLILGLWIDFSNPSSILGLILGLWIDFTNPSSKRWNLWIIKVNWISSSVAQSCPTLWDPMDCSTPCFPVHYQLPELAQTHVHRVGDAIQPSHPLSSPSPPAFNLSQHQGLFQWISFSHQVAKVLEFQLLHQSFQWTPRTDLL